MISTAREIFWLLSPVLEDDVEQAWALALNSHLQLIEYKLIAKGTVDQCTIHPRDVFRFVITKNASSFLLVHNHPSGNPQPSPEDLKITKKILKLSWLHEIPLLDHIILTSKGATSIRALGQIRTWNN